MGVEFRACIVCKQTYPDCGDLYHCYAHDGQWHYAGGCEAEFCSKECAKPEGEGAELTCIECRGENTNDANLLAFLLGRAKMTRTEAVVVFLARAKA